ncbi:MAG: helix-turn-helix domain-containing protein [Arenicella sp.]|nr:helix-turn-helix domain-containing protein [Arenicella sp.]
MKKPKPNLWSGDVCISEGIMAFIGHAGDNSPHSHATLQITLSHTESLRLEDSSGRVHTSKKLYVRPGIKHALLNSSKVTLILIEPQSSLARYILSLCPANPIGDVPAEIIANLNINNKAIEIVSALKKLVVTEQAGIDPRLSQALLFLRHAPLKNAIRNAATTCHLSESRLRAIATKHLEIPLSKWVLWCAIARASNAIAEGESLAEAAVTGGFADQAHYTRTLHKLMGITPGKTTHLLK